jgi:transcriptional regulator with XRE-family HTH domain
MMTDSDTPPSITVDPGAALKSIRTDKGWTLAEVSKRTKYPVSTLSKIENGKTELTIEKLVRISLALGVNIVDLFAISPHSGTTTESSRRRSITRAGEGEVVSSKSGTYNYHAVDLLEKQITPVIGLITARNLEEFGSFRKHAGEEFVFVLEGDLVLHTDTYGPTQLKAGDSIYFDSSMGHAYVAGGDSPCRILTISSTPQTDTLNPVENHEEPPPPFQPNVKTLGRAVRPK